MGRGCAPHAGGHGGGGFGSGPAMCVSSGAGCLARGRWGAGFAWPEKGSSWRLWGSCGDRPGRQEDSTPITELQAPGAAVRRQPRTCSWEHRGAGVGPGGCRSIKLYGCRKPESARGRGRENGASEAGSGKVTAQGGAAVSVGVQEPLHMFRP